VLQTKKTCFTFSSGLTLST